MAAATITTPEDFKFIDSKGINAIFQKVISNPDKAHVLVLCANENSIGLLKTANRLSSYLNVFHPDEAMYHYTGYELGSSISDIVNEIMKQKTNIKFDAIVNEGCPSRAATIAKNIIDPMKYLIKNHLDIDGLFVAHQKMHAKVDDKDLTGPDINKYVAKLNMFLEELSLHDTGSRVGERSNIAIYIKKE